MDKDEFVWKAPKDIWKGVGIYHLTFNVACDALKLGLFVGGRRRKLLQFITRTGISETDDVICNTVGCGIGALLGVGIFRMVGRIRNK